MWYLHVILVNYMMALRKATVPYNLDGRFWARLRRIESVVIAENHYYLKTKIVIKRAITIYLWVDIISINNNIPLIKRAQGFFAARSSIIDKYKFLWSAKFKRKKYHAMFFHISMYK
jgi:hypothetical protein